MICVVEDASEIKHSPGEQDENRLPDPRAQARRKYVKFFQGVTKKDARICIRCQAELRRVPKRPPADTEVVQRSHTKKKK